MPVAEESIHESDECYRCGYDLRGIVDDQACPECGLLAGRSRRETDELHNARPRWLACLSWGVWLILLALVSLIALTVLQARLGVSKLAAPFTGAGLLMLGAYLLTRPEGYASADTADRRRRIWLRILAGVPLLVLIAFYIEFASTWSRISLRPAIWAQTVQLIGFGLIFIVASVLPALLFFQLRALARRARSAHLAEHCAIAGIGTSLAFGGSAAVVLLLSAAQYFDLISNTFRRSTLLYILLILLVAIILFLLWSLYLLIRFAIAFQLAGRTLKRQWRKSDRAAEAA